MLIFPVDNLRLGSLSDVQVLIHKLLVCMVCFAAQSSNLIHLCCFYKFILPMHALKLYKCDYKFLFFMLFIIKFLNSFYQLSSFFIYFTLFLIQLLLLLWIVKPFVLNNLFFLVQIMQMLQHMHPSKVIQRKVNVHYLVLIFVNNAILTWFKHYIPVILHVTFNPSPQLSFKLKMTYSNVRWQVSYFYSEISCCDMHLIQLLAYDILIPLLKRDQNEGYENYKQICEDKYKANGRF